MGSDTFALDDATRNNDDVDVDNNYRWTGTTQAIRDLAADAEVTVKLLHVSGDDTLSGLSLSDVTLDPVFASGTEAYTASAAYAVAQVTVTPTANESTVTVEYLGTGDAASDDACTLLTNPRPPGGPLGRREHVHGSRDGVRRDDAKDLHTMWW